MAKTFRKLIAEVAQPAAEDEINFKEKHVIDHILDPNAEEDQFSANKIKKFKNRADYKPGEDKEVYEALDPVGKEDHDIDNDGKLTKSDLFLHARRRAINKKFRKEAIEPVVPTGGEFDSDESHRKYKKGNKSSFKVSISEDISLAAPRVDPRIVLDIKKKRKALEEVSIKKLDSYRAAALDHQFDAIDDEDHATFNKRQNGRDLAKDKIYGRARINATRHNFVEAYIPGSLKLKDGASVTLNSSQSDLLNKMFNQLKDENRKKMESTLMSGKDGFNQIISFAKEAV